MTRKSAFSGFRLEYPGRFAVRHRLAAAVLLALTILASIATFPAIRFDDNVQRVFTTKSAATDANSAGRSLVVLVESKKPFGAAELATMRDFALDLQLLNGVTFVLSPFSMHFAPGNPTYPGQAVIPFDIEGAAIADRLAAYREDNPGLRPLIAPDLKAAMIYVSLDPSLKRSDLHDKFAKIRALPANDTKAGLTYTLTGVDAIAFDIAKAIKVDLVTLNGAGSVVAIFLAFFVFGSLRTTAVVVIPALFGAAAMLSLFTVLGFPVTVMSNVVPILVLVLGIADSIHLTMYYLAETEGEKADRIKATVEEIGPACALTALTTAIGFAAIGTTSSVPLREMAILGACGVMVGYVVVLVSFVLLAPFCAPRKTGRRGRALVLNSLDFIARWALEHSRWVMAAAFIVALAGGWAVGKTEFWFPMFQNIPESSPVRHANAVIEREFGGYFQLRADLDISGQNDIDTPEGWARLTAFTDAIQKAAPDYSVISLVTAARWLGHPDHAPTKQELNALLNEQHRLVLSPDGDTARVVVFVPEPMRDHTTRAAHDRIEAVAYANGANRVSGFATVLRHDTLPIIRELAFGLAMACFVAVLVVAAAFRWPMLAVALLIPNVLPLLLSAAALHLLNFGQINPTSMLALTVAFGIAVDDSVHFTNRYRMERNLGCSVEGALRTAIGQTGRVMIITTTLISAGTLVTLTSEFATVRLFGEMLIATFLFALLADLLLLPALLRHGWFRR